MSEEIDPRANDRLWAMFVDWRESAPPADKARLERVDFRDVSVAVLFAADGVEVVVRVSVLDENGLHELMNVAGSSIGLAVVGGKIRYVD